MKTTYDRMDILDVLKRKINYCETAMQYAASNFIEKDEQSYKDEYNCKKATKLVLEEIFNSLNRLKTYQVEENGEQQ